MRANVLIVGSEVQAAVLERGLTSRGYNTNRAGNRRGDRGAL